ncbi:Qat anti-phage system QueC-like protein QatC [Clostridium akagii]|uniref:Qat anti-phage system QueC-like protein QatC n=1 Tax=Clostridium akagii TaxID=91623 RepID=UPI00047CB366|nr:Qat anti-phage system QueC-like protein QatC [Clostridium akagii]
MIISCKVSSNDDFSTDKQNFEINLSDKKKFTYTFWKKIRKMDQFYDLAALDLLYISLMVFATDRLVLRKDANDSWSRKIELYIPVLNLEKWNINRDLLQKMIGFLSGDSWVIHFRGRELDKEEVRYRDKMIASKVLHKSYDRVCMFSGGLDSFIGVIDILQTLDDNTLFVSHYGGGKGTKEYQDMLKARFIEQYNLEESDFCQFYASVNKGKEDTTRTRSFMFFSHAIALASAIGKPVEMIIPENGMISLNIPFTNSRLGTSSTRTTHPYYIQMLQELIGKLGLSVSLRNPYQYLTKGEMLLQCKNQDLLKGELHNTMSCSHPDQGRMRGATKSCHCGYCLPCVIRKAAIKRAGLIDNSEYFDASFTSGPTAKTNINSYKLGLERFNPKYSFLSIQKSGPITYDIDKFTQLYIRGMKEVGKYLEGRG